MPALRAMVAVGAAVILVAVAALGAAPAWVPEPTRLPACTTTGPLSGLTDGQAENARIVAAIAEARLGPDAALIAVMTALTESNLRTLANPHDPTGTAYPHQGLGYDHDSLGLFQQRPGWGTAAARMDPVASTNLFLDAVEAHPGWRTEPAWQVAQDVQQSAFNGMPSLGNGGSSAYGGNYLTHQAQARAILNDIGVTAGTATCGAAAGSAVQISNAGSFGLPPGYGISPDTPIAARRAVTFALAQLGKPYLWGATGPDRFDCSGLTQAAWRAGGHQLGRTTWDQAAEGSPTSINTIRPGDLVLIPGSDGSLASPTHVGLYVGSGLVVHAPKSGDVVRVTRLTRFISGGLAGVRHIA
ncbi:C40 family peptidase [Pedococcus sp. 5OH_020]|uniref:C40 family peptidase n=1 Tax=Pedococcus sp. 5OH_020 TaxID=2989814 RepID=UPI0022E9E8B9|nr:C40 family peptidase [Pedococcus sp. 5OH_020]